MTWECPNCHTCFSEAKTHECPPTGYTTRRKQEHPDVVANRYALEAIRKAAAMLCPVQDRVRAHGVDKDINDALNALKRAEVRLTHGDGNGRA